MAEQKHTSNSDIISEKLSQIYFNSANPKTVKDAATLEPVKRHKTNRHISEIVTILVLSILVCAWIVFTLIGLRFRGNKFELAYFDKETQNSLSKSISTQGADISLEPRNKIGYYGSSLRLDYNVAGGPANRWNRVVIALNDIDARPFKELELFIKGDDKKAPSTIKLEFLSPDRLTGCYIKDISNQWLRHTIPLAQFNNRVDLAHLTGLAIIFEDWNIGNLKGSVYIDKISLTK